MTVESLRKTNPKKGKQIDPAIEKRNLEIYKRHKEGQTFRALAKYFGISSTMAFNIVCRIDYMKINNK